MASNRITGWGISRDTGAGKFFLLALFLGLALLAAGCSKGKDEASAASTSTAASTVTASGASVGRVEYSGYDATDPVFSDPYIDLDEWRDEPVRHRYIHGGFNGTDTRFSFYFPPVDRYQGRFFQYITPVPDSETLSQGASGEADKIGFSIGSGAYFIETNGGGRANSATPGSDVDPTIGAFRANAATAQFSRAVAGKIFGGKRPYGYAFGGSGGAFRTIAGAENTEGVWDGYVPFVLGSPMAIPNVFTVRTLAMRVLDKKMPEVADAVDVGSNKNPFDDIGLNDEERAALVEATRMGFPLQGWHAWNHLGLHAFALLFPAVVAADPSYFEDFWTKPGYAGYEPTASLKSAMIHHKTRVAKLIMADEAVALGLEVGELAGRPRGLADDAWKAQQGEHAAAIPVAIQVTGVPSQNTLGTDLVVESGEAAGIHLPMARLEKDIAVLSPGSEESLAKLRVGDELLFDNRNFLAVQTYHRHQVPGKDYMVWNQFRDSEGNPIYPQRPVLLGPPFARGATGVDQTGRFHGKMILLENLYDTEAFAWQADWYRARAKEYLGPALDNHFRLWMTDHANHGDFTLQVDPTHTISYLGVLQQALRDLSAWVERGVEPPANTVYEVVDGQIEVPASAGERKGIQPVVTVTANGNERAEVKAGDTVELVGVAGVPRGTGELVAAEWDIDDEGTYPVKGEIVDAGDNTVRIELSHRFDQPGVHFVTLRVASQRDGDSGTPFARIQNLGRARVIVE